MSNVKLSEVTVDFESSVLELIDKFSDSLPWANQLKSNVGTVLVDMVAATTTNNQFFIESSVREAYLDTAKRYSSVYALARSLGVRISRRTSAKTSADLKNNSLDQVFIPAYDTFNLEGRPFFNREGTLLKPGERASIILYEGVIHRKEFDLSQLDLSFLEISLGEPGFVISDSDVRVYTKNTSGSLLTWGRHDGSILELDSSSTKFFDSTTGEGDVNLLFGDGKFGSSPNREDTLIVLYALTSGSEGNGGLPGQRVTYLKNNLVVGQNTEPVVGGTAVKDKVYYKKYAPLMFSSKKRMVSAKDWKGNIGLYPGVGDVAILSQRDIAPNDPSWRGVVRVCILPSHSSTWGGQNPNPRSAPWLDFLKWAEERIPPNTIVQSWNPTKILTDISIEVAVFSSVQIKEMQSTSVKALEDMFKHSIGSLGKRLAVSDLVDSITLDSMGIRRPGVDYVKVLKPTEDIVPTSRLDFVSPKSIKVLVRYTERELF
jgi:hypothetical protein